VASGELWPVLVVPGAVLVSLLVFFVNARFRLPAVPMLCVFAGLALDGALRLRRVKERVAVGAVFLVVTLGSGVMLPAVFGEAVKNDEVYGWINLSQNQLAAGDLQQAGQLLDRAAGLVGDRQNDDLARAYAWVGNRYLDRRDLGGAAGAYDKAIRSDHAYAPGYLMRGVVELTRGSADRALELAGEAIGSDPRLANAWVLRAKALLLLDRREEALASAAEAQRLDPDAALVRELLQQLGPTP
jgi:tetratricopeptide (TPR) repeat protein